MSIATALSILGAGLGGYSAGTEQNRQRTRQDEDDAFRREQRERQKIGWQRDDDDYAKRQAQEQADLTAAAAPVPKAAATRPDTMDDRDVGQPGEQSFGIQVGQQVVPDQAAADTAVQQAMTPQARMARVAGVQRDPMRAAQIQQQAGAAELQQGQMQAQRRQQAVQVFDDGIRKAAGTWGGLTAFLNDSKADGADGATKFAVKKAGGKVTLFPVGPDGTALGQGSTFTDDEQGRAQAAFLFARGTTPEMKLKHIRDEANAASLRDDREADNKRQAARDQADDKYRSSMLSATRGRAGGRGAGAGPGAGQAPAVAWDDKSDERLFAHYGKEDPTTGAKVRDGNGVDFAKQVALAISARNGGDTLRAVGQAIDIDAGLKGRATKAAAASGGKLSPEDALRAERAAFLNARRQEPAPAGAAGPAPAAVPQPRAGMQAATAAAPAADPMAQRAAQESSELNRGARMEFSPEVKQYMQARKAAEAQATQAASEQMRQKELQRALALSKQQATGAR